jgi:hypothetical protein
MANAPPQVHVEFSRFGSRGLRVHVTGTRSLESTVAYWSQIAARVAGEHPQCLLVLDDLRGTELTPAQWKDLVQEMGGRGLEDVRIAHVKLTGYDDADYCEIYANIAGFDARAFRNPAEAERWLRYGSPSDGEPLAFATRPRG